MENLFGKFVSQMEKCGALDKVSIGIGQSIFESFDLDLAENAWKERGKKRSSKFYYDFRPIFRF